MAIASYWASGCFVKELSAVVDVQDVLDQLVQQFTVNHAVADRWTSLGGGVYRSPAISGVYLEVTFAVLDTEDIAITVKRNSVTLMAGRFRIDDTGTDVRVYSGPSHFALVCSTDVVWAALAETAPILPPPWPYRAGCFSLLDSDGNPRGVVACNNVFSEHAAGGALTPSLAGIWSQGAAGWYLQGLGGKQLKSTVDLTWTNLGNTESFMLGTLFGLALVDRDQVDLVTVVVEVDTGTTRDFDVLPLANFKSGKMAIQRGTVL